MEIIKLIVHVLKLVAVVVVVVDCQKKSGNLDTWNEFNESDEFGIELSGTVHKQCTYFCWPL